ncbi:MAG: hypothetical protein KF825_06290 [Ferruginibacter sp.]|nr:hypothetical protein [Ferruginibacter sp.]
MMKELKVKYVESKKDDFTIEDVSGLLDTFTKHKLDFVPWPQYPLKPSVSFSIAHNHENIFLKFYVQEKYLRAQYNIANSAVYQDSCVEFFVSFDEGASYYNFEFNCIGTGYVAYKSLNGTRQLLDEDLVNGLRKKSVIITETGNDANWQLTLQIPFSIFIYTANNKLKEKKCRANFYKCGDLLPEPHFITWSNIISEKPNFHLPEYFGRLVFE